MLHENVRFYRSKGRNYAVRDHNRGRLKDGELMRSSQGGGKRIQQAIINSQNQSKVIKKKMLKDLNQEQQAPEKCAGCGAPIRDR